jgi:hypothetical protein
MKNSDEKKAYNRSYYMRNKAIIKTQHDEYDSTTEGVWAKFKSHKLTSKKGFKMEKEDFCRWYEKAEKVCFYCNCNVLETHKILKALKIKRFPKRLEFDRKDNLKGYTLSNIVLACTICNIHKTGFFSSSEFLEITKKYLRPKFKDILSKAD